MKVKYLRRFSASSRSNLSSKTAKAELNFKEGNEIANPYDIIDRNVPSLEQRLRLHEMRRLREQLKLDRTELDKFSKRLMISSEPEDNNFVYEIRYSVAQNFPGMNCPSETSSESSVTVFADFKSLGLSKSALNQVARILNIDADSQSFEFSVSDFPLVSQNKSRAAEILQALIDLSKNNEENVLPVQCEVKCEAPGPKLIPEFPQEWLQIKKKDQYN